MFKNQKDINLKMIDAIYPICYARIAKLMNAFFFEDIEISGNTYIKEFDELDSLYMYQYYWKGSWKMMHNS